MAAGGRPLAGRGAVVTGGGRGIGAAVAKVLAAAGARVVVAARTASEIAAVADSLRQQGAEAWPAACDVSDESGVKRLGLAAREHLGSVDVLVNGAGDATGAPFAKLTLAEWNEVMGGHATGTFLCTREFVPPMVERGWGRVVNVASVAGLRGAPYVSHYCAAKHAMLGFARSVAREVSGTGVTVSSVCPAYVDTPLTRRAIANVQSRTGMSGEAALAAVLATTGQDRLLTAGEVADAVLRLCEEETANGLEVVLPAEVA